MRLALRCLSPRGLFIEAVRHLVSSPGSINVKPEVGGVMECHVTNYTAAEALDVTIEDVFEWNSYLIAS